MTQVFADGEQLDGTGVPPTPAQVPVRPMVRQRSAPDALDACGPALTAGKGVRPIRCVGCSQPTLPRHDDNAPLCARCSDVLAESGQRPVMVAFWRRRWLAGD